MRQKNKYSPYHKLHPVEVGAVQWGDGFWGKWFERSQESVLPSMRKALDERDNGAVFSNFYVAAGLQTGEHLGTPWSDGDCYKWMEAVCHVYGVTKEIDLIAQLDELIEVIDQAQDDDGYICTQIQLTERGRWENLRFHELYNMGHLLTAASVHHRVTGKTNFLQIAINLGNYLYDIFQPRPPELAHFGFNPSNIMGAADLYRETGEQKYLELAQIFVEMRGSQPGGSDQNQAYIPLREETRAVGHGVTAGYLYCGAADVYAETGDSAILEALERIWENMVSSKMYLTGGNTALHHGASMRPELGGRHPEDLVSEAFGHEFQLPNATAYNETCANIANAMWNWRMLELTGDAKYADIMELVLYNSFLSAISQDGTHFTYTNPLRWHGHDQELLSQDRMQRWYTLFCYCCPTNTARALTWLHNWVYSLSEDTVWVHLYGGSTLDTVLPDGSPIKLSQTSNYPWDGKIKLTINNAPEKPVALKLRIPGWAKDVKIKINSKAIEDPQPGTYLCIEREWLTGDQITVRLSMSPRIIKTHPKVEETRNHIAVMNGPIVYCVEGVDLPANVKMSEIYAPRELSISTRFDPEFFGGMNILEGTFKRIYDAESKSNAEKSVLENLYQEAGTEFIKEIQIQLIPYFAWNNRGITEMTVWIPRC
ncbi:MAG: glycoside hydrolase family 127 protein [Anaerolineales bacterium]